MISSYLSSCGCVLEGELLKALLAWMLPFDCQVCKAAQPVGSGKPEHEPKAKQTQAIFTCEELCTHEQ